VSGRENPEDDLDALSLALRRLPTPMPPPVLVERVRALGHLELAGRADEKLNALVLGGVILFVWTVNVFAFAVIRLLTGDSLLRMATGAALPWTVGYFVTAWVMGAAVLILGGIHVRRERGLA
jgi:hypothetical protein